MTHILHFKKTISLALSAIMVLSVFSFSLDYSLAETTESKQTSLKTESEILEQKTTDPEKKAEYDGYIVSIKDKKVDAVSETEKAEELPSTYEDKFYLIDTTPEALELASASSIEYMEPNYLRYLLDEPAAPNDPTYLSISKNVYEAMGINALWQSGHHGQGVKVAVLDSGFNYHTDMTNPKELYKAPIGKYGELVKSAVGDDLSWHGTAVSSLIHATYNNGKGIAGIADKADLISINVFHINSEGKLVADSWQLANAFNHFLKPGKTPDVINMSLGGEVGTMSEERLFKEVVNRGAIVIASQGNDGKSYNIPTKASAYDNLSFPASDINVIGVAGIRSDLSITNFSNKNAAAYVSAWGEAVPVLSALNSSQVYNKNGTSFSSPIVAGVAASLKSGYPNMNQATFMQLIRTTSTDAGPAGWDAAYGYGIINGGAIMNGLEKIKRDEEAAKNKAKNQKKYKITLKVNKGKKLKTKSKKVKYNSKVGKLPIPKRKGYNFLGWKTKKKGGKGYTASSVYKKSKNITLYANWTKKKVVKFKARGGTISTYAKAVKKGKKYGSLPKPKRAGYKFKGWYTKKNGGKKITSKTKVKKKKNFTVYARWVKA